MKKTIDSTFLHYGIRTSDMDIIEGLCTSTDFQLNPDWVKDEILKSYNEGGNDQGIVEVVLKRKEDYRKCMRNTRALR